MHLSEAQKVHFIAIGGAGMSGIAWVMLRRGFAVSGSDLVSNSMTRRLAENGARCFVGHKPEQIDDADLIVVSTAIREDNCELQEARRRNVPIWHRSQALGALLSQGRSIAVTGSHGKTTTTAMVGLIFEHAGMDPTVLVGGEAANFGGTARAGRPDLAIAELDESDRSFLRIQPPSQAIITNIETDHLDHYANYEAIVSAFEQFVEKVGQPPVVCADDRGVQRILAATNRPVVRYSVREPKADCWAANIRLMTHGSSFDVMQGNQRLGSVTVPAPGIHNVSNALAGVAVAVQAGLEPEVCCRALSGYRGVGRRLTVCGEVEGVLVVDDYAHHPTEIQATLAVGRNWADSRRGRLVCIFQPHRYTRTAKMGRQFGPAFSAADEVVITGVYAAGERPIEGITGALIADSIRECGHSHVRYVADCKSVADLLTAQLHPGDVVMTLGAGDIGKAGDAIREKLAALPGREPAAEVPVAQPSVAESV